MRESPGRLPVAGQQNPPSTKKKKAMRNSMSTTPASSIRWDALFQVLQDRRCAFLYDGASDASEWVAFQCKRSQVQQT